MSPRIVVGLPSYNEKSNIAYITKQVDEGLSSFHDAKDCEIVNVDSGSTDGTRQAFLDTETHCRKTQFNLGAEARGKGKNLLKLFEYCAAIDAAYIVTIDSDIISLKPWWIAQLVMPVLSDSCDYVCPLYKRSRFEGSTTNHFAMPLILSRFGLLLRQPIGGEFAFHRKFIDYVLSCPIPETALSYGIDIFMTCTAFKMGCRIQEVVLGEKLHTPSFSKIYSTFTQTAQSTFNILRVLQGRRFDTSRIIPTKTDKIWVRQLDSFPHKNSIKPLLIEQLHKIKEMDSIYSDILGTFYKPIVDAMNVQAPAISADLWARALYSFIKKNIESSSNDVTLNKLGRLLFPIFLWRASTFWLIAENMSAEETERNIIEQAYLVDGILHNLLRGEKFETLEEPKHLFTERRVHDDKFL